MLFHDAAPLLSRKSYILPGYDVFEQNRSRSVRTIQTWPLLPQALRVGHAWGFEYVTGLPWIKLVPEGPVENLVLSFGTGFWVRGCSELIMIWRRGKPALPKETYVGLVSERFKHSRKPANLYELAESMDGPYLELFAREQREGWDVFGDEVEGSIEL